MCVRGLWGGGLTGKEKPREHVAVQENSRRKKIGGTSIAADHREKHAEGSAGAVDEHHDTEHSEERS
jgi:hypothetical protein